MFKFLAKPANELYTDAARPIKMGAYQSGIVIEDFVDRRGQKK